METTRALMQGVIDYAGLFPPAGLDMQRTVANFAKHRAGEDGWALGRLVVPVKPGGRTRRQKQVCDAGELPQ